MLLAVARATRRAVAEPPPELVACPPWLWPCPGWWFRHCRRASYAPSRGAPAARRRPCPWSLPSSLLPVDGPFAPEPAVDRPRHRPQRTGFRFAGRGVSRDEATTVALPAPPVAEPEAPGLAPTSCRPPPEARPRSQRGRPRCRSRATRAQRTAATAVPAARKPSVAAGVANGLILQRGSRGGRDRRDDSRDRCCGDSAAGSGKRPGGLRTLDSVEAAPQLWDDHLEPHGVEGAHRPDSPAPTCL